MTDKDKKAELDRIVKDLEGYVATFCPLTREHPHDFVDEKCNDAYLMLQEAAQNLKKADT